MVKEKNSLLLEELKKTVCKTNALPLYQQLHNSLERIMRTGMIAPNEKLPCETEFSAALNMNARTVQKALTGLYQKGLLKRIRKAGTFACPIPSRNKTVGFFYPAENFPIMSVGEQIQLYLAARDIDLKIIGYNKVYFQENDFTAEVRRKGLDGIMISVPDDKSARNSVLELERMNFPIVRISNSAFKDDFCSSLVINDIEKAFADSLDYLKQLGHSKIGILGYYEDKARMQKHLALAGLVSGWNQKMLANLTFSGSVQEWQMNRPAWTPVRNYLDANQELTAIIVEHPAVCVDVARYLSENGKRIPQDVSIMCLVDSDILLGTSPAITSMHRRLDIMADKATEFIFDAMEAWPPSKTTAKIALELIERGSTAINAAGDVKVIPVKRNTNSRQKQFAMQLQPIL
jgi:DNA-binding LacI/PurR family transcriptional regulator